MRYPRSSASARLYIKFGLRNAADVYPAGTHLDTTTVALRRERVRRARLGLDVLQRSGAEFITSKLGAEGLTVPDPTLRASSSERATANRSTDVTP